MWTDFDGTAYTQAEFAAHIAGIKWTTWKPKGITLHNTAAPTLAQWAESGPAHDARIRNLQKYYEGMGWHAGPHLFVSRNYINGFSNLLSKGVHSRCFNATHIGIECIGDYDRESWDSGDGAKVRDNAVFAMAVLYRAIGGKSDDLTFHRECKLDNHACPGRLVVKADVVTRVKAQLAIFAGQTPPRIDPAKLPASTLPKLTVIARDGLNLRGGPGMEFPPSRKLPFGTALTTGQTQGDWIMVDIEGDGKFDGYVHRSFLG